MNSESQDHLPSTDVPPEANAPAALTLTELGKPAKNWTLRLHPSHLELEEVPGTPPYVILRDPMLKTAALIESMQVFAITRPVKVTFKLTPEATAILAAWIGKPALVTFYLKRRYAWILPLAIIWLLGSLPLPGGGGVDPIPFDALGMVLGFTLIVSWALAKWRPHPMLFLVDSLWFLVIAGRLLKHVFIDGRSKGWLVVVFLLLWMVVAGFKHFWRFRGTKVPRPSSG